MTITLRYIEDGDELEARWAEIWPLIDAGHQLHAALHKRDLRLGRADRARNKVVSGLENGEFWFQIAEQDGEIVGYSSNSIRLKGRTHPGPICDLGDMYLKEAVRGQGLSWRMYETQKETLQRRAVTLWESASSAFNARALEAWRIETWGCSLRRGLRRPPKASPLPVAPLRRVKNLDHEWDGIWRLLQPAAKETEAETRARLDRTLARRGAVFIVGQEPAGIIIGQIFVDPWLFVERVGVVTDLQVKAGEEPDLAEALLSRLEQWMGSKQATDIETLPLRHGEYQAWENRGFEPYFFWTQVSI